MNRPAVSKQRRIGVGAALAIGGAALLAAACGGGTSSSDKTATANAGPRTPLATARADATRIAASATAGTTPAATTTPVAGTTATASTTATAGGVTVVKVATDAALGTLLTDGDGMTLYIFKNDVANSGTSAAENLTAVWPPLTADTAPAAPAGATGTFAIITRADGKKQVTYNGLPLYYFVNDRAAGETNGQGIGNVWFVVAP